MCLRESRLNMKIIDQIGDIVKKGDFLGNIDDIPPLPET